MDLFFEIYKKFRSEYALERVVKYDDSGIALKIFSNYSRIISVHFESDQEELCYLTAALRLVEWISRNYDHAPQKGADKWILRLQEQLDYPGGFDEFDNAKEGW